MSVGRILSILGALVALACFFLPWVTFSNMQVVLELLPPIIREIIRGLLAEYSSVSGWQLSVTLSIADTLCRVAVLFAIGGAVVGLINAALSMLSAGWSNPILNYIQFGWATLGAILLALNASNLQRLGHKGDWMWKVAASVLGCRLTVAFWGTIFGLAMTAVGALLIARESAWDSGVGQDSRYSF